MAFDVEENESEADCESLWVVQVSFVRRIFIVSEGHILFKYVALELLVESGQENIGKFLVPCLLIKRHCFFWIVCANPSLRKDGSHRVRILHLRVL